MGQELSTDITGSLVDVAIAGWLHAKFQRSRSQKTKTAYETTIFQFRQFLRDQGLDFDHLDKDGRRKVALSAQAFASMTGTGERQVAKSTFNQRLAIISSFYKYAVRNELFEYNPIAQVERAKVQSYANAIPLVPEEVHRRVQSIDRSSLVGMRDYAMIGVFLQTGRRLSEVAALQWQHVHIQGAKVTLVFNCKGGKVMRDTLSPAISQALMQWIQQYYGLAGLKPESWIWVNLAPDPAYYGKPLSIKAVSGVCERHLGTSKVHVMRHTWARSMEEAGAKVSEIQARLGHESLATTGRYLQALKQDENKHADTLASLFGFDE